MNVDVGVVGTGLMGAPMASRLLAAGHRVFVCNRTRAKAEALAVLGATVLDTPADVGRACGLVMLALPSGPDVDTALDELLAVLGARSLVVDTSTTAPGEARLNHERCSRAEVGYVDAPVSGGPVAVQAGTLSVMAGGHRADLDRAEALCAAFAGKFVRCGGPGAGQVAKACNQLVVAATIEIVAEALVLARAAGVEPALVREALLGGFAASRILDLHGERMLQRDFAPGGKARLQLKDIEIIRVTARQVGLSLPAFEAAAAQFERLVEAGDGELDHSAVVTVLERESGSTVSSFDRAATRVQPSERYKLGS